MKVRRSWRRPRSRRSQEPTHLRIGADPQRRRVITRTTTVVTTTWTIRWADDSQEKAELGPENKPDLVE